MSDREADIPSNRQPVGHAEEEELDHEFIQTIRNPSITKDTIINLSTAHFKEIRRQFNQVNLRVSDLRQSNIDLRLIITELRQSLDQTKRQSSETINQLQTELRLSNELVDELRAELIVERSRTVSSTPHVIDMNTNDRVNSPLSTAPVVHTQPSPTTTLTVEKPNIKITQPESFSGEKVRMVSDWLAAVKRYLILSGVEESKWVAYAVTMLTSTALSWWNSIESSNPDKSTLEYSWNEFVEMVRERFVPVDNEVSAMSKMSQWKQTGNVSTYIRQFQSFDQLIPKERLDEKLRVQMFIQGLKPECRLIINMWEPKTLQSVYKMAQKFDNSQRQSQSMFVQHNATRFNRIRITDQPEGTRNNPITFNNTELQSEIQSTVPEEEEEDDVLNQMGEQNSQRGVCFYCKSPDHYMKVCPKLKLKRQIESQSRLSFIKGNRSTSYSKN